MGGSDVVTGMALATVRQMHHHSPDSDYRGITPGSHVQRAALGDYAMQGLRVIDSDHNGEQTL